MPPPTPEQLIKDYEPVLFFHGGDAMVPEERFFPSDAKRYLEHCALWKASTPFLTLGDWGNNPVVDANKLAALPNEGDVYLGKGLPSGPFEFLETPPEKECFLDLAGWEPQGSPFPSANRYANLDQVAALYSDASGDSDLKGSKFWYHAEVFDAARLRRLFNSALETGDTIIHFTDLFSGTSPFLIDPLLLCYYLFYPGHDEGLSDCPYTDQAKEFGSFAGDWTCVAVLLDSPSPGADRAPKWIGLSNRNIGVIKFGGKEVRTGLRVLPWSAVEIFQTTHPRLAVARGSHALYLTTEQPSVVGPLTSPDPSSGSCGLVEAPAGEIPPSPEGDGPLDVILGGVKDVFIIVAKMTAGAAAGSIFGPAAMLAGGIAGLIAGGIEASSGIDVVGVAPEGPARPTVDAVTTTSGKVVHPKGMRPPDVDASRAQEWQVQDNFVNPTNGRRYDSTVDREAQILWPGDPMYKGYTGRWGPRMQSDPQTRRAGMRFPNFWLLFFDALVRNAHPSRVQFLTVESGTTWKVPSDWNNANNQIECIGGGGGGVDSSGSQGAGGAGGGGGYSKANNLVLTLGADITFQVGAGGARAGSGSSAGAGGDTFFNGTGVTAASVGAKGGAGANGTVGGAGGTPDGSGQTQFGGGSGGNGGAKGGGPGGGGAAGPKNQGGKGAAATPQQYGGGGGGGNGGGSDGKSGATGDSGSDGGQNADGGGGGKGGSSQARGAPGLAGGGGGGGGGHAAGGASAGSGGAGGPGNEWDAAHGSGGGGGGGGGARHISTIGGNGGAGGLYGGGGGGGGYVQTGTAGQGGAGANGLIVITYAP
jgi:hypothetical protein